MRHPIAMLVVSMLSPVAPAAAQVATEATEEILAADVPERSFDLQAVIAEGPALSREETLTRAVESAPSLARARALSEAAEAGVSRARAQMLPRLELGASYIHVDGFEDGAIPIQTSPDAIEAQRQLASMVTDPAAQMLWNGQISATEAAAGLTIVVPRDRFNLGARLSWPVSDLFFAVMPSVDSAEHGARARAFEEEAAAAGVRRAALEAYLNLVRARGAHGVAIEAERQAAEGSEEVAAAVRAGFLTPADALAAEARVAEAAQGVAAAMAGVEIADAALRTLIGAEDGDVFGVALDEMHPPEDGDFADALDRRPELRALREVLASQRAAARANDATGYPHLAVFAGADYGNPNRYQVPPTQEWMPSWEVGASLTWSPNDTLTSVHRGDELGAEQLATEARIRNVERMIRLEVRRAQAEHRAAERSMAAADAALAAATAAYESRLAQLRAGNATTSSVYDAERQLNRARLSQLDARVQIELAHVHLAYALGTL